MGRTDDDSIAPAAPGGSSGSSDAGGAPRAVVVGFDGSVPARDAASWAAREAATSGRPLRLLMALRWPLRELADLDLPAVALDPDRARHAASAVLDHAVTQCREQAPGLDVQGILLPGDAVEALAKAAADAGLLVLGASGQTATSEVLLGSSAAEVLRNVATPVVVVRNRPAAGRGPVVIGVDGSPASDRAVRFGFDLAARNGHDVIAVHTWSDIPLAALAGRIDLDRGDLAERATAFLAARVAEQERIHRQVRVHPVTAADRPGQALLAQADGAALLVVGRHGRARTNAPLGSVSHAVAHYASCPVAVIGAG